MLLILVVAIVLIFVLGNRKKFKNIGNDKIITEPRETWNFFEMMGDKVISGEIVMTTSFKPLEKPTVYSLQIKSDKGPLTVLTNSKPLDKNVKFTITGELVTFISS